MLYSPHMAQGPLIAPGDLIVESWENFRKNFRTYAEFVVWFALLGAIQWALSAALQTVIEDRVFRTTTVMLASLPVVFIVVALTASMIDFTAKALRGKKPDTGEMLSVGLHKVFPFIWVSFLAGCLYLLGTILFLIPLIIFVVWYRFSQAFVVVDGIPARAALTASRKLVTGRWWSVFARVAAAGLFFYVAAAFATALAYLIIGSMMGDPSLFFGTQPDIGQLSNTHTLIMTIVPNVINGFALPLFFAADLILWYDLKRTV
jgi:hypothetical protein